MDLDEISVNVYGDTAVSFTSQEEKSTYGGRDTRGHYHFTDVWVKKGGRWQVVASHGSRFDEPHKEVSSNAK
jgi:ketosteroid isomerase-like protein